MSISNEVIEFYIDVFNKNIVRSKNMVGFRNGIFDNPIMTPNFVLNENVTQEEIVFQTKQMKAERLWLNCFESRCNHESFGGEIILCPEFVMETRSHSSQCVGHDFCVIKVNEQSSIDEYLGVVERNSFNLSIVTQKMILNVLLSNNANVEVLVSKSKVGEISCGATLIHGKKSTLFINGFVDNKFRGSGLFKNLNERAKRRCFDRGNKSVLFWTFNEKLKGRGENREHLKIIY